MNPAKVLGDFLQKIGVSSSPTLATPSWNGKVLEQVHPWGTIRTPTTAANKATGNELGPDEKEEIRRLAGPLLVALGYD